MSIDGHVRSNINGIRFPFRFLLKNVGNSPAMLVAVHVAMVADALSADLIAEQRRLCDPLRSGAAPRARRGLSLFPEQEFTLGSADHVYWDDLRDVETGFKPHMTPAVVGCVTYRFASNDDGQHQTGFVYAIYRNGGPGRPDELRPVEVVYPGTIARIRATGIPAGELSLVPAGESGTGFYAD